MGKPGRQELARVIEIMMDSLHLLNECIKDSSTIAEVNYPRIDARHRAARRLLSKINKEGSE